MTAVQFLKLFLMTAGVFFAIDLVWIGFVAAQFYERQIGSLLAPQVRWLPAVLFYLIYITGLLVFAIIPGLSAESLGRTAALGAFLGFMAYATFDLTCLALFRDFPVKVAVVDMIWGTCLSAAVTSAGYGIGRWLGIA